MERFAPKSTERERWNDGFAIGTLVRNAKSLQHPALDDPPTACYRRFVLCLNSTCTALLRGQSAQHVRPRSRSPALLALPAPFTLPALNFEGSFEESPEMEPNRPLSS